MSEVRKSPERAKVEIPYLQRYEARLSQVLAAVKHFEKPAEMEKLITEYTKRIVQNMKRAIRKAMLLAIRTRQIRMPSEHAEEPYIRHDEKGPVYATLGARGDDGKMQSENADSEGMNAADGNPTRNERYIRHDKNGPVYATLGARGDDGKMQSENADSEEDSDPPSSATSED